MDLLRVIQLGMKSETNTVAYIAGFFDGEGCISYLDGTRLDISITQKDRAPLEFIQNYFGMGHIYTQRQYWQYRIMRRKDQVAFLEAISPYLIVKQAKAEEALRGHSRAGGGRLPRCCLG
jgi:intein-encoded DNA endonuclease-like protein